MECEHCHAEIADGALACPRCGNPISKPVSGEEPVPPPEQSREIPPVKEEYDFTAMAESEAVQAGIAEFENESPGKEVAPFSEQVEADIRLTGGYQGPEAPSVAGAGTQTADDPFGLEITEKAPPPPSAVLFEKERPSLGKRLLNIAIILATVLAAGAVVMVALYFGFLREKSPQIEKPTEVVKNFFKSVSVEDYNKAKEQAVPGAPLLLTSEEIFLSLHKRGWIVLRKFDSKLTDDSKSRANVEITCFEIELNSNEGQKDIDVLKITQPLPLPRQVQLIKKNGKWLINS